MRLLDSASAQARMVSKVPGSSPAKLATMRSRRADSK